MAPNSAQKYTKFATKFFEHGFDPPPGLNNVKKNRQFGTGEREPGWRSKAQAPLQRKIQMIFKMWMGTSKSDACQLVSNFFFGIFLQIFGDFWNLQVFAWVTRPGRIKP